METPLGQILLTVLICCCIHELRCIENDEMSNDEAVSYANTLRGFLSRSCMYGFGVSGLRSSYDPTKKDRLWKINCRRVGFHGGETCRWTEKFVNDFKERLAFKCDRNFYIAGLFSDFNKSSTDRTWRVECCNSPRVMVKNRDCRETDWVNSFGGDMIVQLEPSKVLRGLHSYYDSSKGDRRWRFDLCNIKRRERPASRYNEHMHG